MPQSKSEALQFKADSPQQYFSRKIIVAGNGGIFAWKYNMIDDQGLLN